MTKRVHVVAYGDRDPKWIFVPDPYHRGRYCRVPYWFAFTTCPQCGALEGQPCVSDHQRSYTGTDRAHVLRRSKFKRSMYRSHGDNPEDVIDDLNELWKDVVEGNSP